jgi:hypothetical protein
MTEEIAFEDPKSTPGAPRPAAEEGRDVVLTGERLPPATPLRAHLAPLQSRAALDLPREMPKAARPRTKFEDDIELQLNAMLGDCRFLMRDVAYRCIAQASDAAGAMEFLQGALGCAQTGARVAEAIARLRAVPLDEDRRTAILLETNRLIGAEKGDSEKQ